MTGPRRAMLTGQCIFLFTVANAYRSLRVHNPREVWKEYRELNVKLWTWNSGKANLTAEAERLRQDISVEEVLVTCQTEATVGIKHFMKEEWQLVGHAEHWGAAGGNINAQIASLFLRTPPGGALLGNVSELVTKTPWRSDIGSVAVLSYAENDVLRVVPQTIATDYKGKGGVSFAATFPRGGRELRIDFVCAHLDSESAEARHAGTGEMLSKVRSYDREVASTLRKQAVGGKGNIRMPCALFDRGHSNCSLPEMEIEKGPDAVVFFGDLNYRLAAEGLEEFPEVLLLDHQDRAFLAKNDRLRRRGSGGSLTPRGLPLSPDVLVKPLEEGGFGFTCDEPFDHYPPTYKRKGGQVVLEQKVEWEKYKTTLLAVQEALEKYRPLDPFIEDVSGKRLSLSEVKNMLQIGMTDAFPLSIKTPPHEACEMMGKAMKQCGQPEQPHCEAWVLEYAKHCYVRKDKQEGGSSWATKKDDLQLGWLDRFCYRSTSPELFVTLSEVEGWVDYPGAKDKKAGSDHMPVAAEMAFSTTGCSCDLPLHMQLPGCEEPSKVKVGGELGWATCEDTYMFPSRKKKLHLVCNSYDGTLTPWDDPAKKDFKCLKVCRAHHLGGRFLLEGEESPFDCSDDPENDQATIQLGDKTMVCESDGILRPKRVSPFCAHVCSLKSPRTSGYSYWPDFEVKHRQELSEEYMARYGDQLQDHAPLKPWEVLSTGSFELGCRDKCIILGGDTLTCNLRRLTAEQPLSCGCRLHLQLKELSFESLDGASSLKRLKEDVEKVKLQLYEGPISEEELEQKREHKGYLQSEKFTLEELKAKPVKLSSSAPANLVVHLTLCSKHASGRVPTSWKRVFSSCNVLAMTTTSSSLETHLHGAETSGDLVMEMTLVDPDGKSLDEKVRLSFEYEFPWNT